MSDAERRPGVPDLRPDSPVLGTVDRMLALLDQGYPPVHEMAGAEARAAVGARVQPVTNTDDVRSADDVRVPTEEGSVRARVYRPHGDSDEARPAVVFAHGGGFVLCSVESHDGFCRSMARHLDAVVVSVDYRLAPETRAPGAAEDTYAALRWVVDNAADLGVDPGRVLVAGDSAGGNLAAAVCLMARERGGPEVLGQVLVYPVVEPDFESEGYRRYPTGHFNTRAAMEWYWQQYLPEGGLPALAGPVEHVVPSRAADLAGLPPAVVVTAGRDPLGTEGARYVAALRAAGVPVRHRHYPELFHGFLTMLAFPPGASARDLLWSDVRALLAPSREATR